MSSDDETTCLLNAHFSFPVYRQRWYILFLFSLTSMAQCAIWNTWGPIALSANAVYGWNNNINISLLPNWANMLYVLGFLPTSICIRRYGLRKMTLIAIALCGIGCSLRIIPTRHYVKTILFHVCAILNSIASPIVNIIPPFLSSVWFPANERTTATAISASANMLGMTVSFLLGNIFVDVPNKTNSTNISSTISKNNYIKIENQISVLLTYEAVFCGLLFIVMLFYFPALPPNPPSLSASTQRYNVTDSLKKILRLRNFWLVCIAYAMSGVYGAYTNVLDVDLKSYVSQSQVDWIGFYCTLTGTLAGVIVGRLADLLRGRIRLILLALYVVSFVSFLWLVLLCKGVLPVNLVWIYMSNILGCFGIYGIIPLSYEICCEICYPIGEEIPSGVISVMNSIFNGGILLVCMILPGNDFSWLNYSLVSCCFMACLCILFFRDTYNRLNMDITNDGSEHEQDEPCHHIQT